METRNDLAKLFTGIGVEIGVERGHFAKVICQYADRLYAIDPWKAYQGYREHVSQERQDGFYEETKERLKGLSCEVVRKFSTDAAKDFEDGSLDFVYIDANHTYESVMIDMITWLPKLRQGGIMAGHDYSLFDVAEAVSGYVSFLDKELKIWRGDKSPSWSFIK